MKNMSEKLQNWSDCKASVVSTCLKSKQDPRKYIDDMTKILEEIKRKEKEKMDNMIREHNKKEIINIADVEKKHMENEQRRLNEIKNEKLEREKLELSKISLENNVDIELYSKTIKEYFNKNREQIEIFSKENNSWLNCVSDVLNEDLFLRDSMSKIIKFRLYFFYI